MVISLITSANYHIRSEFSAINKNHSNDFPGNNLNFSAQIEIMKERFPDKSKQLEAAFDSLNQQFESLNLELQDSNYMLQNKVAELDVLANYLKNIFDNMVQGILVLDLNGMVTTCNAAAEKILGIKSQKILFKRFWDLFEDNLFGFSMHTALNLDPSARHETATYNILHGQSELEIVTAYAGQDQGLILMLRDVTEMRHLQTLAARADRMKALGEMAAQVAHEIRNPLGGIKGFASLLKRDLSDRPSQQKMAASIVEGTDNLDHLVDRILHYSRPVHPHPEKTDLIALLQDIKTHLMADANILPNIAIKIDAPFDQLLLNLDPALIKSALLNLLVNAVQAMPNGGTVGLSVQKQPACALVSISDTGTGISEENLAKLYSPFFTTKPQGNGLGLAEVQKVVQAHGGTIDVMSTVNKGTTFTIKLPFQYH